MKPLKYFHMQANYVARLELLQQLERNGESSGTWAWDANEDRYEKGGTRIGDGNSEWKFKRRLARANK